MARVNTARLGSVIVLAFAGLFLMNCAAHSGWQPPEMEYPIHSHERPQPPIIDPGTPSTQEQPGEPPSDAIVLFREPEDLENWSSMDGSDAKWVAEDGYMEAVKGAGYVKTRDGFGDCQLHVEWATPLPVIGKGQGRGNSGVFLMGMYEVQVLDSYQNTTYPDGQAAALYGQYPPLVNASRAPREWQMYDVVFHRPRFDENGELMKPATVTVFHNGVLVQDHVTLTGPTANKARPPYQAHPDKLPLSLQDHGNPVRFRNIWIRPLED